MVRRLLLNVEVQQTRAWQRVREAFPTVTLERDTHPDAPRLVAATWSSPTLDLLVLDAELLPRANSVGAVSLVVSPSDAPRLALEVLTHLQPLIPRRNRASLSLQFARALAIHRAMHDLSKPLVHADWLHALDAWHWTLRLDPHASTALQLAALFHDIERLRSEAEVRIEQHARDYQAFKDVHAAHGGRMLRDALKTCGFDRGELDRAAELVTRHERPDRDRELALLNDADALSFFSRNCAGYLNYFGPAQTKKKVAYTLARLQPSQRRRLDEIRMPAPVRTLVESGATSSMREERA